MRQRLNFDSKFFRILFHRMNFFFRIPASKSPKMRILRNFIGIFCIKQQIVHSQKSQVLNIAFYSLHFKHAVPGTVKHDPQTVCICGLRTGEVPFPPKYDTERPVILNFLVITNLYVIAVF